MKIVTDIEQLRKPCEPVKMFEIGKLKKNIIPSMIQAMIENGGCGLASTQIGIHKRFFIATIDETKIRLFINPTIVYYSAEETIEKEGCLSVPDVRIPISRSNEIKIKYFDVKSMKVVTETYTGMNARIIQHEYDHLQGVVCVIDKAS